MKGAGQEKAPFDCDLAFCHFLVKEVIINRESSTKARCSQWGVGGLLQAISGLVCAVNLFRRRACLNPPALTPPAPSEHYWSTLLALC